MQLCVLIAFLSLSDATSAPRSIHSYTTKRKVVCSFRVLRHRQLLYILYLTSSLCNCYTLLLQSVPTVIFVRSVDYKVLYSSSLNNRMFPRTNGKLLLKQSYVTRKTEYRECMYNTTIVLPTTRPFVKHRLLHGIKKI